MKSSKKHPAEQLVSPIIDPPTKISLTLNLKGDTARLWRAYHHAFQALDPSDAQLATALIDSGLRQWEQSIS